MLCKEFCQESRRLRQGSRQEEDPRIAPPSIDGMNGDAVLGLKGTISELELHTIRSHLTAGLLAKAERGNWHSPCVTAQPTPVSTMR
jgi:DNA invertase Pin-like site-specific DNA recombinase